MHRNGFRSPPHLPLPNCRDGHDGKRQTLPWPVFDTFLTCRSFTVGKSGTHLEQGKQRIKVFFLKISLGPPFGPKIFKIFLKFFIFCVPPTSPKQ